MKPRRYRYLEGNEVEDEDMSSSPKRGAGASQKITFYNLNYLTG